LPSKNSKKRREERSATKHSTLFASIERKNVSGSGNPGRGGENSRVQNRHGRVERSGALSLVFSFFLSFSLSLSLCVCVCVLGFVSTGKLSNFLSLSLWDFSQSSCRFKNFLSRFQKEKRFQLTETFAASSSSSSPILLYARPPQVLEFDGSNDAFRCVFIWIFISLLQPTSPLLFSFFKNKKREEVVVLISKIFFLPPLLKIYTFKNSLSLSFEPLDFY
jgi:hypothetical protein